MYSRGNPGVHASPGMLHFFYCIAARRQIPYMMNWLSVIVSACATMLIHLYSLYTRCHMAQYRALESYPLTQCEKGFHDQLQVWCRI